MADDDIKAVVRDKYGKAALRVTSAGGAVSCGSASTRAADPISSNLYGCSETAELPAEAVAASLGCGNPTALAELSPGEVVLDLGSGGGIDVLLSARRAPNWPPTPEMAPNPPTLVAARRRRDAPRQGRAVNRVLRRGRPGSCSWGGLGGRRRGGRG